MQARDPIEIKMNEAEHKRIEEKVKNHIKESRAARAEEALQIREQIKAQEKAETKRREALGLRRSGLFHIVVTLVALFFAARIALDKLILSCHVAMRPKILIAAKAALLFFAVVVAVFWSQISSGFLNLGLSTLNVMVVMGALSLVAVRIYKDETEESAKKKLDEGNFQEALVLYRKLIARGHGNLDYLVSAAYITYKLEQFEEAIDFCDQILKLQPSSKYADDAHVKKASAHEELCRYESALEDLSKLKKETIWTKYHKCTLLLRLNRRDEAFKNFDELIGSVDKEMKPDKQSAFKAMCGYISLMKHDIEAALIFFDESLSLKTDYTYALWHRSFIYCVQYKLDLAQKDIEALEKAPDFKAYCLHRRAQLLWRKGKTEDALGKAKECTVLRARDPDVLSNLALMLLINKKFEEALGTISEALEIDPNHAESYFYRSVIFEKLNRPQDAQIDRKIVEELGYKPFIDLGF